MKAAEIYSRLSIRYKILISFCLVILVISLSLGYYSYHIARQNVMDKIGSANLEIARKIGSNLDFLQKDMVGMSVSLSVDPAVQRILNAHASPRPQDAGGPNPDDVLIGNSLQSVTNLVASKSYPINVILYANDPAFPPFHITNNETIDVRGFAEIAGTAEYKEALAAGGKAVWFGQRKAERFFASGQPHIAVGKIVKDLTTLRVIGFLLVSVNEQLVRDAASQGLASDKGSVAVIDRDGHVLSYAGAGLFAELLSDRDFIGRTSESGDGYVFGETEGGELLVAYNNDNLSGWRVYYAVETDALTRQVNSIRTFTATAILACVLLSFPIVLWILSSLTAPIYAMLKSMKRFQKGNFDEKVTIRHLDEMGELSHGYNRMIQEIKELIDRAYVSQIKEREAELNALQAQINPHFLYNTLDMILMRAERSKESEIADMIYSLSQLFRLSLNRGDTFTVVSREKELVEHYLLLQKIRFKSRLRFEIAIDDDILDVRIPKLILQPFVENAIVHGIESLKSDGLLTVRGFAEDRGVKFVVEDNGGGMDPETAERLLSRSDPVQGPDSPSVTGGYAVRNVNERLQLAYKDKYSLRFVSEPGKGTRVEIAILDVRRN